MNDARSSAELDKFKQAGHQEPATPTRVPKRSRSSERESSPTKTSPKQRRNKARRERQKALLARAKASVGQSVKEAPKKAARDERIPEKEWKVLTGFKYSGKRRCPFFNSSLGCRFGDGCRNAHSCVESRQSLRSFGAAPWLLREGCQIKKPIGTNDVAPPQEPLKVPPSSRWKSWSEVPSDPREVARLGPWSVEIFSGTARLTEALLDHGLPCLPPIDVTLCAMVPESFDVVDADRWEFFMQLVFLGPSSTLTLVLHAILSHPPGKKMEVLLHSGMFITQTGSRP